MGDAKRLCDFMHEIRVGLIKGDIGRNRLEAARHSILHEANEVASDQRRTPRSDTDEDTTVGGLREAFAQLANADHRDVAGADLKPQDVVVVSTLVVQHDSR